MGAKAPSKLKLRRPTYKCDACDRKFLSAQALKSHRISTHDKYKRKPVKVKTKLTNLLGKAVKKQGDSLVMTTRMSDEKIQRKAMVALTDLDKTPAASETRKIQFECPQCLKLFGAYFIAYRHIQKYHCINDKGQSVLSSAADLIKPVRIEICKKCDMRVRADNLHLCSDRFMFPSLLALTYICAGCKQKFNSIQHFDLHVSGVHCDGIESYFFPTLAEFMCWKDGVEDATETKYLILGQCNTKQIYRCTYLPPTTADDTIAHICPATIVVREYSKGIQVHFYKQHHGHPSDEYRVPDNYKKYTITTLMQKTKLVTQPNEMINNDKDMEEEKLILIDPLRDETDLYVQFKTLMDTLVVDAAKMNIKTLKVLIGKAQEMSTIVSQYVEDDELGDVPKPTYLNKNMSDNEIAGALESFKINMKRNVANPSLDTNNIDIQATSKTPMILNTFSLAEESVETTKPIARNKVLSDVKRAEDNRVNSIRRESPRFDKAKEASTLKNKEKQDMNITPAKAEKARISVRKEFMTDFNSSPNSIKTVVKSPNSISCFNDSYKEFVVKNFIPSKDKAQETNSNNNIVAIEEVKTAKRGVIAVNNETTNIKPTVMHKINNELKRNETKLNKTKLSENKVNEVCSAKLLTPTRKTLNKKVNQVISPKINSKIDKIARIVSKKKVVKTRIGQFKPSISPKNIHPVKAKNIEPVKAKNIEPVKAKNVESVKAKNIEPVKAKNIEPVKAKNVEPVKVTSEPLKVTRSPYGTRKVKADFKYEVKKQENDCNILILKF